MTMASATSELVTTTAAASGSNSELERKTKESESELWGSLVWLNSQCLPRTSITKLGNFLAIDSDE